jgi:hypothetical protein
MGPAKRLGIYGKILDEQTQREVQYERYYSDVENRSGKSYRDGIPSRSAVLIPPVSQARAKTVLVGYGSRDGDAKMHASHEQTGEEVVGLDGERP